MPLTSRLSLPALLVGGFALALGIVPARATTVLITYQLDQGSASLDPFTVPNPNGGADVTITPALTIDAGSFEAVFESGSPLGAVSDGPASIRGLNFSGSITIGFTTIIDLGIVSPTVTAELNGPLVGTQISDAFGSILGQGTLFSNTTPGNFDVTAGPLECTDSIFGIFCGLLETGLNLSFPLDVPAVDDAPLPFTGNFDGLDTPGASTAGNTFDFSVPVGDANSFGVAVEFLWTETDRLVIPEPSHAVLSPLAMLILARRRRRRR